MRVKRLSVRFVAAIVVFPVSLAGQQSSAAVRPTDITIAVTGDAIGPYDPVAPIKDPRIAAIKSLLSKADATFGNQEGAIFDVEHFKGFVGAENGGGTPLAPASVAVDLRSLGLSVMSKANNHAVDYGLEGLRASELALDAAGIAHAGSGKSLQDARRPVLVHTKQGTVALVATTSTFPSMSPAGDAKERGGTMLAPRPGLSVIHVDKVVRTTPANFASLRRMSETSGGEVSGAGMADGRTEPAKLRWLGQTFEEAAADGLHYEANERDEDAVLRSIASARGQADRTIFSIHAHETASGDSEDPAPADFLPPLFHRAIEAGADVVVRHGPHALRGIEVYHGRPIFYGMASLFMGVGDETRMFAGSKLPASYDEGVIALVHFRNGALADVRLFPIVTIRAAGLLLGSPALASPESARAILQRLQLLSAPYGTRIRIENGVGIIDGPKP